VPTPGQFTRLRPNPIQDESYRGSMVLPLLMLTLLILPYVGLMAVPALAEDSSLRGCIGLAVMFSFTGLMHFVTPRPMAEMIPPQLPARLLLIYVTGVIEIAAGLAVLLPAVRVPAGWFLIAFLVLLLPFNVYAAIKRAPVGAHAQGPIYLLARVPLQLLLMGWCYWFAVRPDVG
jgi:uncharacterized membrane protein